MTEGQAGGLDADCEALRERVAALEAGLRLMLDTFAVRELTDAWRWDIDNGAWELIEPYANAAWNAHALLGAAREPRRDAAGG